VRFGGILRETVIACAAAAAIAVVAGIALGHVSTGLGLAAGLVIGAFNAHAVAGVLQRKVPFVAGTVGRLVFFSVTAVLAAVLIVLVHGRVTQREDLVREEGKWRGWADERRPGRR